MSAFEFLAYAVGGYFLLAAVLVAVAFIVMVFMWRGK